MGLYIKWCGGSVVLVDRYYVDGIQKERYVKAIEAKTTKARLDVVRETYFTRNWKTLKIGTVPVMMKGTPSAPAMMRKKKTIIYDIEDLTRLQKLEAQNRSCEGEFQSGKLTPQTQMNMADRIRSNEKEIDRITKGRHKSGSDIAKDRERGRVIVTDKEGNVY